MEFRPFIVRRALARTSPSQTVRRCVKAKIPNRPCVLNELDGACFDESDHGSFHVANVKSHSYLELRWTSCRAPESQKSIVYSLIYLSSGNVGCFETVHRLVWLLRNVVSYGIVLRFDLFYITSLRISQMLLLAPTIITVYRLQLS